MTGCLSDVGQRGDGRPNVDAANGVTVAIDKETPLPSTASPSVGIVMPLGEKFGGSEHQLINLLKANRAGPRVKFKVCFLTPGPLVGEVRALGYETVVFASGRLRDFFRFLQTVHALCRWVENDNIVYLISWMEKAHFYASAASAWTHVPAAWWLRSIDPKSRSLRWLDRLPADRILACSHAAAASLRGARSTDDITVCYSGFDPLLFDPDGLPPPPLARQQLGLPLDRSIVVMVARLQAWKGLSVFIDAAASLLHLRPKPLFLIVGGDHALEEGIRAGAEAQIARLHVEKDVRLVGFQANAALWMQASDLIVHASTSPEPLGMVIAEAMALGKNIIAAKAGGPTEIITDGVDGRLVAPGDPVLLSKAIVDALQESEANASQRRQAKVRALDFRSDRLAADVDRLLASRLGDRVPRLSA